MARLDVRSVLVVKEGDVPNVGASWIAQRLEEAIKARGLATLVLSGGNTPRAIYEVLATLPVAWDRVHLYFGDERCVPPDDPLSNFRMAREALFDRVRAPHVYRIQAERADREAAAREYAAELPDALDLILLGMGEDGHTESLTPGQDWSRPTGKKVITVTGFPKPPPDRLSITPDVIWAARNRLLVTTGAGKAAQVKRALEGDADPAHYPVHTVRDATWLLDPAAAALLSSAPRAP